jgi:muramoyltetrapeptide carboxypeptidase
MTRPPYLKVGDQIALVSPARKISMDELKTSLKMLQNWGLEVVFGQHIFARENQFAGSDAQRAIDIQRFMDNPAVKAIMSTRGGYGSVRIIDKLDFRQFSRFPKWFIGYSDVTVFHSHLNAVLGVESLHATMPINFPVDALANNSTESLRKALFGELETYSFKPTQIIREKDVEGELIGGNLSIIYSLMGSDSEMDFEGKILFIEDLDEYLYHIDRMMMNLKRARKLDKLAAILVGGMSDMNDNTIPFGKSAEEIIAEHTQEYDYPVIFGFPAGHIAENWALYLGRKISVEVHPEETKLFFL